MNTPLAILRGGVVESQVLSVDQPAVESNGCSGEVALNNLSRPDPFKEGSVPFIQIPDWLKKRRDVPATEKLLLGQILTMQITMPLGVFAGIPHLAEQIGLQERQTRNLYNDLLKRQWIAEKGQYIAVADWIVDGTTMPEDGSTVPTFGNLLPKNGTQLPRSRSGSKSVHKISREEQSVASPKHSDKATPKSPEGVRVAPPANGSSFVPEALQESPAAIGRDAVVGRDRHSPEMMQHTYYSEIETHWQRAMQNPLRMLTPKEWVLIEKWEAEGIPLAAVLRGIDIAMAGKKGINSLAYCEKTIRELAGRMVPARSYPTALHLNLLGNTVEGVSFDPDAEIAYGPSWPTSTWYGPPRKAKRIQ